MFMIMSVVADQYLPNKLKPLLQCMRSLTLNIGSHSLFTISWLKTMDLHRSLCMMVCMLIVRCHNQYHLACTQSVLQAVWRLKIRVMPYFLVKHGFIINSWNQYGIAKNEEKAPPKVKVIKLAEKAMVIIFGDCHWILLIYYLSCKTTINAWQYCEVQFVALFRTNHGGFVIPRFVLL